MRLSFLHTALLLFGALVCVEAAKPAPFLSNPKALKNRALHTKAVPHAQHELLKSDGAEEDVLPAVRNTLDARAVRGGDDSGGLNQTLLVGSYFLAWYFLNVMYNSEFMNGYYSHLLFLSLPLLMFF